MSNEEPSPHGLNNKMATFSVNELSAIEFVVSFAFLFDFSATC